MRWSWAIAAGAALALAACERTEPDPLASARASCLSALDPQDRIAACTAVVESDEPDNGKSIAFSNRARALLQQGEVTPALRDFEAALRLDGTNATALLGRARILLDSGQLDAAEPLLQRAVEAHNSGEAHEMMGRIALQRGQFAEAATHFDAALERSGQRSAAAMAGRARAKQQQGELDGARADYDAAVRLDGALAEARAGRCWLSLTQERELDQARTDAEAGAAADPRLVEAQLCLGVLQLRGGEWAGAQASFEAALAVEPGNPTALFGRGVARRRSGDNAGRQDMNQARDFDRHVGEAFDEWGVETY